MMYLLKTPVWMRKLSAPAEWDMPASNEPAVYLTFDDGPHPKATTFVVEQLAKYNAQATFFCIGKNVVQYPGVYESLLTGNHSVGNHTHNHLRGWSTGTEEYVDDVRKAAEIIRSDMFRPPYGRIKHMQAGELKRCGYRIIMWSLLSGDFDRKISPQRCLENVVFNLKPGDIVVFHDSEKAWDRMSYALPRVLEHCRKNGWRLKSL